MLTSGKPNTKLSTKLLKMALYGPMLRGKSYFQQMPFPCHANLPCFCCLQHLFDDASNCCFRWEKADDDDDDDDDV